MSRSTVITFRIVLAVAGTILLAAAGLLLFLTLTQYRPDPLENVKIKGNDGKSAFSDSTISILTWNIGYGGLGKEADFFYDGGTMVRPTQNDFERYIEGLCRTLRQFDTTDFILIQEADLHSRRSYYTDEPEMIAQSLPSFCHAFGKNYDCRFVPMPVTQPMGRVVSGIITLSKCRPSLATRVDFGTNFGWPTSLAFLKRCFLVMRFPMQNGKELIVINTHNSAFDEEGELRKKEMDHLAGFMMAEFLKGNYVIAGGDWNQNPPGFDPGKIETGEPVHEIYSPFPTELEKGWQVIWDPSKPTNRNVDMPYHTGTTKTTIIDFFVVSPNVKVESVKTIGTGFEYSDHQPVLMNVVCPGYMKQ